MKTRMRIVVAIDLGARPAAVVAGGTDDCPVLLATKRWSRWDSEKIVAQLKAWVKRYPGARVWCEETFSHGTKRHGYLRDVGRVQEGQAGFIQGMLYGTCEVLRMPPVNGNEAQVAWIQFGRPDEGKGPKGEHLRDSCGIALKGLIRQNDRAAVAAQEA